MIVRFRYTTWRLDRRLHHTQSMLLHLTAPWPECQCWYSVYVNDIFLICTTPQVWGDREKYFPLGARSNRTQAFQQGGMHNTLIFAPLSVLHQCSFSGDRWPIEFVCVICLKVCRVYMGNAWRRDGVKGHSRWRWETSGCHSDIMCSGLISKGGGNAQLFWF